MATYRSAVPLQKLGCLLLHNNHADRIHTEMGVSGAVREFLTIAGTTAMLLVGATDISVVKHRLKIPMFSIGV